MSEENNQDNNAGGNSGSPSSGVTNDVKPETHFADKDGVPYYNRVQELQRKLDGFKDVDLDLYSRAKELDLDEAEEALQFKRELHSDPAKLAKVLEILKGQQQADANAGKEKNPELQAVIQELNAIKAHLQGRDQSSWMKEYDSSMENSIAESLKNEAFKDLGGKLSEFEKQAVMKLVDDTFQADAAKGKAAKLSIKDVPNVVQSVLKMVLDNRKGALGGMVRKDTSPEAMKGSGSTGQPKQKPMTDEERIEAMKQFVKDADSGRVPVA